MHSYEQSVIYATATLRAIQTRKLLRQSILKGSLCGNGNSRRLRWAGHVARMEEGRIAFKILTCKPTEKRPLGRPRRR